MPRPRSTPRNVFASPFAADHTHFLDKSRERRQAILRSGVIVLDTNAWLDLYRFHHETRAEVIKTLKAVSQHLWTTHQVRYEVLRNRAAVISEAVNMATGSEAGEFHAAHDAAKEKLRQWSNRRGLSRENKDALTALLDEAKEKVDAFISASPGDVQMDWIRDPDKDAILGTILDLIEDRVGRTYTAEEISELATEASDRFANKIPPGFKDAGKKDNSTGDFIFWIQSIEISQKQGKSLLLVTNDTKDDWFHKVKSEWKPLPALDEEYNRKVEGKHELHIATLAEFLELAKEAFALTDIADETIASVRKSEDVAPILNDLSSRASRLIGHMQEFAEFYATRASIENVHALTKLEPSTHQIITEDIARQYGCESIASLLSELKVLVQVFNHMSLTHEEPLEESMIFMANEYLDSELEAQFNPRFIRALSKIARGPYSPLEDYRSSEARRRRLS